MQHSFGYILNQRPFRDSSVLVDLFTEDYGRIRCVARPAKKRGKIIKGNLEPFRYLKLQWTGKGDLQTLTEADERGRHKIPASELMLGIYLNELLLLLTRQHVAQPELFSAYKYTLHKLSDSRINQHIMMRFEVYLLACLGYPLVLDDDALFAEKLDSAINHKMRYRFTQENGLERVAQSVTTQTSEIFINAEVLAALADMQSMSDKQWKALRHFLDAVFKHLSPRVIHSRRLLKRLT